VNLRGLASGKTIFVLPHYVGLPEFRVGLGLRGVDRKKI
jgi:hypothetical protein